jgi:VWFA-related protein
MRFSAAMFGALLLLDGSVRVASQDRSTPQSSFRSGVELVYVDVSVLDSDRRPVRGLEASDFVVREDGRVRPIAAFSAVDLPDPPVEAPVGWMRDVAPDVVTNLMPREGRLVVILLDAGPEHLPGAQRTAQAAVDQLGPGDLAAVIFSEVGTPQNFTADKRLLREAINRPFVGLADDDQDGQRGVCPCGVCKLNTITRVADAVRDVPRRRKMLFYIGGSLPGHSTNFNCFAEVRQAREELLHAAGVANLAVHTFDSNLLETLAPTARSAGAPPLDRRAFVTAHLERQGDMMMYADATGGRAIKNTNAPWEPMADVFAESRSYYVLGITPEAGKPEGRYHEITVDVSRRGLSVHSRRGYYSASRPVAEPARGKEKAPSSLVRTLAGLWPETGLPLSVTAAAFAGVGRSEATVVVVLRAQEPALSKPAQVAVLAGAYDREGKAVDEYLQTITVTPPDRAAKPFEYEAISRLRLKPGRHEVRVAAEDAAHDLRGSVYTYVDVPDFARAPLSLSGIVLGASAAKPGNVLGDVLPVTPTAQRQFGSSRRITALVRVYDTAAQEQPPVTVAARIVDIYGVVVFRQTASLRPGGSAPRSADYVFDLPLSTRAAGDYLLTIEATRGEHTVARDMRFGVR